MPLSFCSAAARQILVGLLILLSGCASTGATYRSGVGDAFPEHPPFYAGDNAAPALPPTARIGVLPVYYQPGAAQPALFDPRWGPGTPINALLRDMNAALDSVRTTAGSPLIRLIDGSRVSAVAPTTLGVPPDVMFGCRTESALPDADCVAPAGALGRDRQQMRLAVGRPSREWVSWAQQQMEAADVTHLLVLTLEVANYPIRQRGVTGSKSVELGSDYTVSLPWLTALNTPVAVIQLTGALVDRNGRARRIGAEGLYAMRTPLMVSALGAQAVLGENEVSAVRTQRRGDAPSAPLVWRDAISTLVQQLTR